MLKMLLIKYGNCVRGFKEGRGLGKRTGNWNIEKGNRGRRKGNNFSEREMPVGLRGQVMGANSYQ